MRWNSVLLPVCLIAGIGLAAALIGTTGGGRAGTAAEAHVVVDGPVECGSHVTIDVFLDAIDARTSDLGQPVGLGAYNLALHYPNDALRPADRDATRVVVPDGAPTVDGATGRQWIPGGMYSDLFTGELWSGAFSYVGSPNPSKSMGAIEVVDGVDARERGGVDVAKVAPLHLGTFDLVTGKPGTHVAELTLTVVDSSMASLEYANDKIAIPIEVKDGPCATFAAIEPPPTHPPAPPPFEGWDKIPTPDPYPDDITPAAGELADLGDACATGRQYHIATRGMDLCLPAGWSVTHDPSPGQIETAQRNSPNAVAGALFELRNAEGTTIAGVSVTILGGEPFSLTKCEIPVTAPDLGSVCIYARGPGGHLMPVYWRLIGVTTEAGQWATIAIYDIGSQAEQEALQREALEIVKSMKGGW